MKYQTVEDRWKVIPDIDRSGNKEGEREFGDRFDWKNGYGCALRDHAAPLELEIEELRAQKELRFSEEQVKQMFRDYVWNKKDLGTVLEEMGIMGGL